MDPKKYVGSGFEDGDLLPFDPETPEPLNSLFRARDPEQISDSNSSQNLGSVGHNLGACLQINVFRSSQTLELLTSPPLATHSTPTKISSGERHFNGNVWPVFEHLWGLSSPSSKKSARTLIDSKAQRSTDNSKQCKFHHLEAQKNVNFPRLPFRPETGSIR